MTGDVVSAASNETGLRSRWRAFRGVAGLAVGAVVVHPAVAAARAVVPEISFDAGDVRLGAEVVHDFVVRNEGDVPLHLTEVTPSCGCTVADYDGTIGPGAEGRIKVRIKTGELSPGPTSKTVTVATDAAEGQRFVLQVKLSLAGPIEFLPYNPVYLVAERGRGQQERVLLRVREPGLEIRAVTSDNPLIRASLEPARPGDATDALQPRAGDYWIVIAVQPTAPPGRLHAGVTVQTSSSVASSERLKVEAVVRGAAATH